MSGWVVPANRQPGVQLPPGIVVAGMGRRVGAWLLDSVLAGFLTIIPLILAVATGAVTLNQQALDQMQQGIDSGAYRPFSEVTAPLLSVNVGPLIFAIVVYVVLRVLYFAGCWAQFGGTPSQMGLHLRVADVASGRNLTPVRALLRWVLLEGLSIGVGVVFLVFFLDAISKTPTNQWLESSAYGASGLGSFWGVTILSDLVSLGNLIWILVLIVSAGTNPARRGLHDRLAGSIVVGPAPVVPNWPGYPYQPQGYPPQGSPYWPPQGGPGYPYPPQGGPGYPYPPQGGPGYPYPPQAGQYPPPGGPGYPYPPQAGPGYPPQPTYLQRTWPGQQPEPAQPASPAAADQPADDGTPSGT